LSELGLKVLRFEVWLVCVSAGEGRHTLKNESKSESR